MDNQPNPPDSPGTVPAEAAPPQYPQQPPAYPTGPAQQGPPPSYPAPAGPPAYPGPGAQAPPPAYPQAPAQHAAPPPPPTAQPRIPPQPTAPPPLDPHHISTEQRRVYLKARQRHTDATSLGTLVSYLPHFLASLAVVGLLSLLLPGNGLLSLLAVLAWLLSGLLVFHGPTESVIARRLLRLRPPTPEESARLEPVWREVAARAGIDAHTYTLWIEENDDDLNAVAAAGHIVGVTTCALNRLPNGELAAILAHELGHHVGGHAWASLLGYWYALPGRLAYRVMHLITRTALRVIMFFAFYGAGTVALFFALFLLPVVIIVGAIAYATVSSLYGLPLLALLAPYALAYIGRRSELRADDHAAALGFAPMLASVLHKFQQADDAARHQAALAARQAGRKPLKQRRIAKLLATHPDHHTRLSRLKPWLQPQPPR
ncbi:M48 family metalloprotease [Streptomyces sp. 021-3]|uniref:M48 family metalloprotease n=1 Tax=Streptomyces sp. 021-3 TaxID=2789259 RepID=UPI00398054B1